jgi:hypothetical protein
MLNCRWVPRLLRGPFQFQPIAVGQEFADANHGQHKIRYLSGTLHATLVLIYVWSQSCPSFLCLSHAS